MASYQEVTQVLGVVGAAYPNFKLQKATIDIYARLLEDLDAGMLATAAEQAVAESEFFPTVARIREKALALAAKAKGTPDQAQAWENVQAAIRRYGYEEGMRRELHIFSHANIEATVRMIGWREICLCDESQLNTLRAQFRDAYQTIERRAAEDARMLPKSREIIGSLAQALDARTPRPALEAHRD